MKRNIIDILIEQAIPKGNAVQPKFNPDPRAVLPGKYVGMGGYEFAWNEVTKSYWIKPKKAAAFEWRNMFYEPEYKLLSVKLRAAYDEYVKDLEDAERKAAEALQNSNLSADEKKKETEKRSWFKRTKEKINQAASEVKNQISGKTIFKTDGHFYYKIENGVYYYQDSFSKIDVDAWKADNKVLTPEIIANHINKLPERTETEIVNIHNNRFKAKKDPNAIIKYVPGTSTQPGTNYIILDGIYYSEPDTTKPNGTKATTILASLIYDPKYGLDKYNEVIKNIDTLPPGQYTEKPRTNQPEKNAETAETDNSEKITVITQGVYQYKKENDKYYTRKTGQEKWIDIDKSKLSAKQKKTAKDNIDKMYAKVPAKEKETSTEVGGTKNQALTKITRNITNTYKIGQRYIELVSGKYDAMLEELKAETNEEKQTEIRNKYKDMISAGFDSNILPPLVTSVNEVNGLDQTDIVIQRHSKYVTLNKLSIEMQNEAWKLYILGEAETAADKTKESIIYNIDKSNTGEDIVVQEPYGVDFNN